MQGKHRAHLTRRHRRTMGINQGNPSQQDTQRMVHRDALPEEWSIHSFNEFRKDCAPCAIQATRRSCGLHVSTRASAPQGTLVPVGLVVAATRRRNTWKTRNCGYPTRDHTTQKCFATEYGLDWPIQWCLLQRARPYFQYRSIRSFPP